MLANFFFSFSPSSLRERCLSSSLIITLELVRRAVTVRVSSEELGVHRSAVRVLSLLRLWQLTMWPSPKCDIMNRNPELVDIDSNFNYVFTMVFRAWQSTLPLPTCCTYRSTNRIVSLWLAGSCLLHQEELFFFLGGFEMTKPSDVGPVADRHLKKRSEFACCYSEKVYTTACEPSRTFIPFYFKRTTSGLRCRLLCTVHEIWKCILWWTCTSDGNLPSLMTMTCIRECYHAVTSGWPRGA